MTGPAVDFVATSRLRDGRLITLRRLSVDDAEAVEALHRHLSDPDRYYRFFTLNPVHLEQLVSRLIESGNGQCALGAFDGDELIGVANYTVSDDPDSAEIAIVVARKDHSLGVGTALLKHLAEVAGIHGIRHFEADVLADNDPMLVVLFDFGWPSRRLNHGSVLHLNIELPDRIIEAAIVSNEVS